MKKIIATIFFLLIITTLPAQVKNRKLDRSGKNDDKALIIGIVGGATAPSYRYSNNYLSELPKNFTIGPNAGVFVEIPVTKFFSISPEVMMASKGYKTSYEYGKNEAGVPYNVTYQVNAKYASLRIPFIFRFPTSGIVSPFLFVAPDVSYLLGGKISVNQPGLPIPKEEIEIGTANMKNLDAGAYFGLGLRIKIRFSDYFTLFTRIDLGYNMGFMNTFSDAELSESASPTNINAYNINKNDKRLNRGFELNIHIGVPLHKRQCGCDEINKIYRTTPKPVKKKYKSGLVR